MKRIVVLLASVALIATPAVAVAEEEPTYVGIGLAWGSFGDKPAPIVYDDDPTVAATGVQLGVSLSCSGSDCEPQRPARLELLIDGQWITQAEGTLAELDASAGTLTSRTAATLTLRAVLPAYEGLAEAISIERAIRFAPGTPGRIASRALVKPSASGDPNWLFRPEATVITVRLPKGSKGRRVQIRDSSVSGWPLIASGRTDARGRVTIKVDLSDAQAVNISLRPTKTRAGWQINAYPSN